MEQLALTKFEPLAEYCRQQSLQEFELPFHKIEAIIGGKLPPSAHKPQYWANVVTASNPVRKALRNTPYETFLIAGASRVRFRVGPSRTDTQSLPVKRSAKPKMVAPTPASWPSERLLAAGFHLVGKCKQTDIGRFEYSAVAPTEPGVYAFAVDGVIMYVGLTRGALRTRLGHYILGHEKQRTSNRVKSLILDALANGRSVEVLIARPPQMEWNELPIDGPSGLETGLIKLIRPPWNQQGAR